MITSIRVACATLLAAAALGAHAESVPSPDVRPPRAEERMEKRMDQAENRLEERHAQQRERLSERQQAQLEQLKQRKEAARERIQERRAMAEARMQAGRARIAENHKRMERVRQQRPAPNQ